MPDATEKEWSEDMIAEELTISGDLQDEFTKQSSFYAHWGFLAARAADNVRKWEERVEMLFGQLYADYRAKHEDAKENDCKAFIRNDPNYRGAQRAWRQAQLDADVLRVAVKAFEMRRDMLVQLGAQYRAEAESAGMGGPKPSASSRQDRIRRANAVIKQSATSRRAGGDPDSDSE